MARQQVKPPTRLSSVTALEDHCLFLHFVDGTSGATSIKDSIFSHPGLAPLRDPAAFAGATLAEYGWEVEWPEYDIQIGADTLLSDLLDQNAKTSEERRTD